MANKCITGCSNRTYREDILLLLNCIAENCSATDPIVYNLATTTDCCGQETCLTADGTPVACFTVHEQALIQQAAPILPTPIQAVVPVTWNGTAYELAVASAASTLATFLAISSNDGTDSFYVLNQGHLCSEAHGLTVGEWYCLSTDTAGELVLESTLDPLSDIVQRVLFVVSEDCVYLNLDQTNRNICIAPEANNALTTDIDGCLQVLVSEDPSNALSIVDGELFTTGGGGPTDGWALTGNAGTTAGTNFVGTTDDEPHEMKANGKRLRRIQFVDDLGSIILDGAEGNEIIDGALLSRGCSILGGGGQLAPNHPFWVTDFNTIENGYFTTICGGRNNYILGDGTNSGGTTPAFTGGSIIAGGIQNYITNLGPVGAEDDSYYEGGNGILAGLSNLIQGASISAICAGNDNTISVTDALPETYTGHHFIGSGLSNGITTGFEIDSDFCRYNGITSGLSNYIENGFACHVGGGENNEIFSDPSGTRLDDSCILGGAANWINGNFGSIHGGYDSWIIGDHSHIFGGGLLKLDSDCCGIQNYTLREAGAGAYADLTAFSDVFYIGDYDLWIANTNGTARKIKFFEPTTDLDFSSSNFSSFRAQAQAADIEYIWPATAGVAGDNLKIASVVGTTVTLQWAA